MKRIIVVAVLLAMLVSCQPKERAMAIDFEASASNQYIDFGQVCNSLTQKTIVAWIDVEAYGVSVIMDKITYGAGGHGWQVYIDTAENQLAITLDQFLNTSFGRWTSSVETANTSTVIMVAVSYDGGTYTNDPTLYINGSPVAIGAEAAPSSGTGVSNDSADDIYIGNDKIDSFPFDGLIYDLRIYNRILSASEVATIYGMRGKDNIINGLVFHPMLKGAAGLSTFSGALAAGNTIYDPYSNTYGVPTGSPVAVADNQLGW